MGRQSDLESLRTMYVDALRKADANAAADAVTRGIALGIPLPNLYLDVIVPGQSSVSECGSAVEMSVAGRDLATQITLSEMSRLRSLIQPKQRLERSALVTAVKSDSHTVGARIAADFLMLDGWDVLFLGGETPVKEIVQFAQLRRVDLVCISITTEGLFSVAAEVAKLLRELTRPPKVIIGGPRSLISSEEARTLAVDALVSDPHQLVREARKVVGLAEAETALAVFLKQLGARLQEYRHNREMNQQELADRSGLDRAYISSLENGKQNLTVGAVSKLAEALGVSIEELLVGKR